MLSLLLLLADPVDAPVPPDWNAIAVALITTAQAALITAVVWGTKRVLPKLPRAALPVLAVLLGVGVNVLAAYAMEQHASPIYGALSGALAVWLREVKTTVQEHGAKP